MIAKGFWEKIEDRLQSAIKSFRRKTQPHAIQLVAGANLEIGKLYVEKGDYVLGLHHATKCLMSFNKIHDTSGIYDSYNLLASIHYYKNENEKAKEYNEKCLKMAEKQKNDGWKTIAMANLGNLLRAEDVNKSLNYYLKSLKIFENENEEINIADVCTNIAIDYSKMGDYEKSYEFIKRALELRKERNAFFDIAKTKEIMANIYYSDPEKPVSNDSIIKCLEEALETYEKIGHVRGTASILTKISDIYLEEKKFEFAVANYQKAAMIYSSLKQSEEAELNAKIGLCFLFLSISSVLSNKEDEAYNYLKKIGEFDCQKFTIKWNFSDIESVLDKTGESKQFFIDAITLLKGEVNYPIIRLKDVKIISKEVWKQAEVIHPFIGSLTITKDDENLKEIMQKLSLGEKIDFDTPEIMGMKRDKALLIFGFLFRKGFLDCKNLDKQKFDLKLSERGLKVLGLT